MPIRPSVAKPYSISGHPAIFEYEYTVNILHIYFLFFQ
jgi:hypothetical protein